MIRPPLTRGWGGPSLGVGDLFEPFLSICWSVCVLSWTLHRAYTVQVSGTVSSEATGLVVGDPAQMHGASTLFSTPIGAEDKGLVIQYELQLQNARCRAATRRLLLLLHRTAGACSRRRRGRCARSWGV